MRLDEPNPYFGRWNYPVAKEIMEAQQDQTWTSQEIAIEDDESDYRDTMSDDQRRVVETVLQGFAEIEQNVGAIWFDIADWWEQPDIRACALEIGRMEECVHAFFYQSMSEMLLLEPEEVKAKQESIKAIKKRLDYVGEILGNAKDNKLLALGCLALVEQVLLFSNFAILKTFKSNGYNLISNTVSGVGFVQADEQLHGEFAKFLFATLAKETTDEEVDKVNVKLINVAHKMLTFEEDIVNYTLGDSRTINGITREDFNNFLTERANMVLSDLGVINKIADEDLEKSSIAQWFYADNNGIRTFDFFAQTGNQYTKNWSKQKFKRVRKV